VLVVLLAAAIVATIVWNWNSWEGGRIEQTPDDAYVRGDLTPLSTKVAGIVSEVKVSDFQQVRKGDMIVELQGRRAPPPKPLEPRSRITTVSASCRTPALTEHSQESTRPRHRSLLRRPARRRYKRTWYARALNARGKKRFSKHSRPRSKKWNRRSPTKSA
jgi:hypothetical protein